MANQNMLRIYGNSKSGEFLGANEPFDQPDPYEDFHLFLIRPALVKDNSSVDGMHVRNGTVQIHPTFPIFNLSREFAGEGYDLLCVDKEFKGTYLPKKNRLLYRCWGHAGYGLFTPLCHSHFDAKGACKVFALRAEYNGRLVRVNRKDNEDHWHSWQRSLASLFRWNQLWQQVNQVDDDKQWKGLNLLYVRI